MAKDERIANADEVEITEEMIAAGVRAYDLWDYADDSKMVVLSIYRAMIRAKEAGSLVSRRHPRE